MAKRIVVARWSFYFHWFKPLEIKIDWGLISQKKPRVMTALDVIQIIDFASESDVQEMEYVAKYLRGYASSNLNKKNKMQADAFAHLLIVLANIQRKNRAQ